MSSKTKVFKHDVILFENDLVGKNTARAGRYASREQETDSNIDIQ